MVSIPKLLIGDAYQNSQTWSVLESLTDIGNRMAGQHGEAEGADLVASFFTDLGFRKVDITEFSVPGWWRGESRLTIDAERERTFKHDHELIALPGSPSDRASGEVVDVGTGVPEDFDAVDVSDALALVSIENPDDYGRWVHRTEKYAYAVENGASGFLFYNGIPGCLPSTGNIGGDNLGEIPAVGLSQEVGQRLSRMSMKDHEAALKVEAESGHSTSQNVEALIGPETDEEILLTAHVDAHDITDGATDNGVGCALITEVARLLNSHIDDLDTAVRLVVFGAEEIGFRGSHHCVETHDLDQVKCIVNIDGNGTWENITAYTHGHDVLANLLGSVKESLRPSMVIDDGYLPHSDHWPFVQNGVPGIMIRSESSTGRGWGHTHGDTLDKLDPKPLRNLAIGLTAGIVTLADADQQIEHQSTDEIQEDLVAAGHATGMRAAGGWPFIK